MRIIYHFIVKASFFILKLIALFIPKIQLFVKGRKACWSILQEKIKPNKKTLWIHAASLGEFEQGRPIIEAYHQKFPEHQILVTFFSPSGYEIRKNYELATAVCYLPMDTLNNVVKFLKTAKPTIAIFIKYEFWPNYLYQLKKQQIPCIFISSIFRENQIFFNAFGFWMRKHLHYSNHFFVQDQKSETLLQSIGINQCTIAGDTRFDRVEKLLKNPKTLETIALFKGQNHLLVAGSTWTEDEILLSNYINQKSSNDEKFILVPHNIHHASILKLKERIQKNCILYSESKNQDLGAFQVLIIDTIGLLSSIYKYANVAYIGGGYNKSGVHNTLEAATYGLPIIIGPNYQKFKEVIDLVFSAGITPTHNQETLNAALIDLKNNTEKSLQQAVINRKYVESNLGATQKIMNFIEQLC